MQTIRIPKNLIFLSDKLPQPNYGKTKKNNSSNNMNSNELPDIRQINNRKKPKQKEVSPENNLDLSSVESGINPQVASIKKKTNIKEQIIYNSNSSNNNNQINNQQLNNSKIIQMEDDNSNSPSSNKIIEKREKSSLG